MKIKNRYLVLLAVFFVGFVGVGLKLYKNYSAKQEGLAKVQEVQPQLQQAKIEMIALYKERIKILLDWESAAKSNSAKNSNALVVNEAIKKAADLEFKNETEMARFDFVQNQVSEVLGKFISVRGPQDPHLKLIQKTEEAINRKRKEYHSYAFEVESLIKKYRLPAEKPLIFAAERMIHDNN